MYTSAKGAARTADGRKKQVAPRSVLRAALSSPNGAAAAHKARRNPEIQRHDGLHCFSGEFNKSEQGVTRTTGGATNSCLSHSVLRESSKCEQGATRPRNRTGSTLALASVVRAAVRTAKGAARAIREVRN